MARSIEGTLPLTLIHRSAWNVEVLSVRLLPSRGLGLATSPPLTAQQNVEPPIVRDYPVHTQAAVDLVFHPVARSDSVVSPSPPKISSRAPARSTTNL